MSILAELKEATFNGKEDRVQELCQQALEQKIPLDEIINGSFIAAMSEVGEKFTNNEIFVPEMLVAARAMKLGLKMLEPLMMAGERKFMGKVVIGTVQGDLHDIGKNLVSTMLQGSGYEVIDLGIDVKPERFVEAVREHQPQLLCLSALLTTTMPHMETTIEALARAGLRDKVKVLVGGAPVSQSFADEIGADGYAPDAGSAVELVKQVLA